MGFVQARRPWWSTTSARIQVSPPCSVCRPWVSGLSCCKIVSLPPTSPPAIKLMRAGRGAGQVHFVAIHTPGSDLRPGGGVVITGQQVVYDSLVGQFLRLHTDPASQCVKKLGGLWLSSEAKQPVCVPFCSIVFQNAVSQPSPHSTSVP